MLSFDSPKNIRKPLVFWCFLGDQKEILGRKGLMEFFYFSLGKSVELWEERENYHELE